MSTSDVNNLDHLMDVENASSHDTSDHSSASLDRLDFSGEDDHSDRSGGLCSSLPSQSGDVALGLLLTGNTATQLQSSLFIEPSSPFITPTPSRLADTPSLSSNELLSSTSTTPSTSVTSVTLHGSEYLAWKESVRRRNEKERRREEKRLRQLQEKRDGKRTVDSNENADSTGTADLTGTAPLTGNSLDVVLIEDSGAGKLAPQEEPMSRRRQEMTTDGTMRVPGATMEDTPYRPPTNTLTGVF